MARKRNTAQERPVQRLFGTGKVSAKGWVVIPKNIRDELGIAAGDELAFMLVPPGPWLKKDRRLAHVEFIKAPASDEEAIDIFTGMVPLRSGERPSTQLLVEEHQREVEEDERRARLARRRRTSA